MPAKESFALSSLVRLLLAPGRRTTGGMRIWLDDPDHIEDLLRFLRADGCIAYTTGDSSAIEVLRPDRFGKSEAVEIRALVDSWLARNPTAAPRLEPFESTP